MSINLTFLIGPAYAGKSELVNTLLNRSKKTVIIGTGALGVAPLQRRYELLKEKRFSCSRENWETIETQDLTSLIDKVPLGTCLVVDCLYSWLSNLIVETSKKANHSAEQILQIAEHETQTLFDKIAKRVSGECFLVSTEVGACLSSPNPYERLLREVNGRLNQKIAGIADRVLRIDTGILTTIKDMRS